MNREDIIRMAREAGLVGLEQGGVLENFERFAALVADHEREACAKVCDDLEAELRVIAGNGWYFTKAAKAAAAAIRAQGEVPR
jgi:hypothetical protein